MPHTYNVDTFKNQPEVDCHLEMMNSCSTAHKSWMMRKRLIWFSQWTLRSSYSADCLFCCTTWMPVCMIFYTLAVKMQGCDLSISCRCNLCTELNEVWLQMPGFWTAVKGLRNKKGRHKAKKVTSIFSTTSRIQWYISLWTWFQIAIFILVHHFCVRPLFQ